MYAKLALRNVKRSAKDYLIYIVTLVLCVGMFYSFLSITSAWYHPQIGVEYDLSSMGQGLKLSVLAITLVVLFLIQYVNNYMMRRRQKEFAIQTVMGMERGTTALLFFIETFVMGLCALVLGIFLGGFLSQAITAMLLSAYAQQYQFLFPLYPDTVLLTVLFFTAAFALVGLANARSIGKIEVIDMLRAGRENEQILSADKWIAGWTATAAIVALYMALSAGTGVGKLLTGTEPLLHHYDPRYPLAVKNMMWGNLIAPAVFFCGALWYLFMRFVKKSPAGRLLGLLVALAIPVIGFAMSTTVVANKYFVPLPTGTTNAYLVFGMVFLFFAICGFFYFISDALAAVKNSSSRVRYKKDNLFLLGQVCSKLKSTSKTMSIVCITLAASILLMAMAPVLSGWIMGFLGSRAQFDVQLFSNYNDVTDQAVLEGDNYANAIRTLEEANIYPQNSAAFYSFFTTKSDFNRRIVYDFPVLAIALSDYNGLRRMAGLEPIELKNGEYTTQWHLTAPEKEMAQFIAQNKTLQTDTGPLQQAQTAFYQDDLGENLYNDYTDVVLILPDAACAGLHRANWQMYANTASPVPYETAVSLEQAVEQLAEGLLQHTGIRLSVRLGTLQTNEAISAAFLTRMLTIYTGAVLLIMCFVVLALQQLSDSWDYSYRFGVLRKLGLDEPDINRLIQKQMAVWFGIPIGAAVITAGVLLAYFIAGNAGQLNAYIGSPSLVFSIAAVGGAVAVLFGCYFISTYVLFKRNIKSQNSGG